MICPPSTVYAAYNRIPVADKAIEVYDFNDHEGGGAYQWPGAGGLPRPTRLSCRATPLTHERMPRHPLVRELQVYAIPSMISLKVADGRMTASTSAASGR